MARRAPFACGGGARAGTRRRLRSTVARSSADANRRWDSIAAIVTRYDYRFDLASGEASSHLAVRTDATGAGCVELASRLPLRDVAASPDGAGAPALVAGQADHRVTVCGAHTAGGTFTLDARATVVEGAEPITGVGLLRAVNRGGNAFSYLLGWIEACDRLGPCNPAPARLARFTFEVSHGAGDTVLCPGALIPGGETTRCELLGSPAPTYSSSRSRRTRAGGARRWSPPQGCRSPPSRRRRAPSRPRSIRRSSAVPGLDDGALRSLPLRRRAAHRDRPGRVDGDGAPREHRRPGRSPGCHGPLPEHAAQRRVARDRAPVGG